jgi:CDP-diacylglycerol--glycerol-3-phosphate 3-phosphatidyltransferase
VGISGLGVPYIMQIGLWALAVGSLYTLWQRLRAVWLDAKAAMAEEPAPSPVDVGAHEEG